MGNAGGTLEAIDDLGGNASSPVDIAFGGMNLLQRTVRS